MGISSTGGIREQSGAAVRSDWPRIPLPVSAATLRESAPPGARAPALLNPRTAVVAVDAAPVDPRLRTVAVIECTGGQPLNPGTGTWLSRRLGEWFRPWGLSLAGDR